MIWNYNIEEIVKGYAEHEDKYECVICGKAFKKGHIYKIDNELYDAYGAMRQHVSDEHGLTVDYLLEQDTNLTGISDVQQQILQLMSQGKSDSEISRIVGIANSTVRNHRFKLREKEKQAKLFLALMESLEIKTSAPIQKTETGDIEELHFSATMIDDRYSITEADRKKTVATYFDENGALRQIPSKEKKKIIVLCEIIKNFHKDTVYSEVEVNNILKRIYEEDYPTIRRALIEYGFMDRSDDCSKYRVKE